MLTELKLKNIKNTDKVTLHGDADGLFLRVSKTKMRWQLSFMKDGKKVHFYGGEYPATTLRQAREWAATTRESATTEVTKTSMHEFSIGYFFDEHRKQMVTDNRSPATLKKVDMRKDKYLTPYLDMDARNFQAAHALKILKPIGEAKKLEAMKQVRSLLKNIFVHVVINGLRESNPIDNLQKVLAKGKGKSRASITDPLEFGQLVNDIKTAHKTREIEVTTLIAMEVLQRTFVRPENILTMEHSDIDFKEKIWHIPKSKMKLDLLELDVPLSKQVLTLIASARALNPGSTYVFGSLIYDATKKKEVSVPMHEFKMRKAFLDLGYFGAHMKDVPAGAKFHGPHGGRASARTMLDEVLEFRIDVIEHQLGHLVRDVNGVAYNRTKHMNKRILMMQIWSDFIDVAMKGIEKELKLFIDKYRGAV